MGGVWETGLSFIAPTFFTSGNIIFQNGGLIDRVSILLLNQLLMDANLSGKILRRVSCVAAIASNLAIGNNGKLPWPSLRSVEFCVLAPYLFGHGFLAHERLNRQIVA